MARRSPKGLTIYYLIRGAQTSSTLINGLFDWLFAMRSRPRDCRTNFNWVQLNFRCLSNLSTSETPQVFILCLMLRVTWTKRSKATNTNWPNITCISSALTKTMWIVIYLFVSFCFVSVLGREEGYTVKYGLSPRDCPRAIPRAQALFYRTSRLKS